MLAAQHHKLVAQHQDLDLLGLRRPEAERDQLEAAPQRQVDERPDHTRPPAARQASDDASVNRDLLVTALIDFWHPTRLLQSAHGEPEWRSLLRRGTRPASGVLLPPWDGPDLLGARCPFVIDGLAARWRAWSVGRDG
jgi:hypothetical protein